MSLVPERRAVARRFDLRFLTLVAVARKLPFPLAAVLALLFAVLLGSGVQEAEAARNCKPISYKRISSPVKTTGVKCKAARNTMRRFIIRIVNKVEPNLDHYHLIRGFRCSFAHGDETLCFKGRKTIFGKPRLRNQPAVPRVY